MLQRLLRLPSRANSSLALGEHYRQTTDGVAAPGKTSSRTYWILSRSQYRVKTIALSNVAANRRASAIQLELTAWTPFRQTAHYVVPQGAGDSHALLMAWDKEAVESAQATFNVVEQDLAVIPEGALRSSAIDASHQHNSDGGTGSVHIFACLDGIEAVVSRDGITIASQWWSAPPKPMTWANFQRIAGIDLAQRSETLPSALPVAANWLARPLGYAQGQAHAPDAEREIWLVAVAALLLAIPTLWFANDYRRHAQALSVAEARLATTEQELDGLLGARGNAVGSLARVARFDAAFNQIDALSLFAEVSRTLGAISKPGILQLAEWDWRPDGSDIRSKRLKMIFTTTGIAPAATTLVKAFEANPAFHDVQVNGEGSRLGVEMRVEPLRPDAATPAPASASTSTAAPATATPSTEKR